MTAVFFVSSLKYHAWSAVYNCDISVHTLFLWDDILFVLILLENGPCKGPIQEQIPEDWVDVQGDPAHKWQFFK